MSYTPRTDVYQDKIRLDDIVRNPIHEFYAAMAFARQIECELNQRKTDSGEVSVAIVVERDEAQKQVAVLTAQLAQMRKALEEIKGIQNTQRWQTAFEIAEQALSAPCPSADTVGKLVSAVTRLVEDWYEKHGEDEALPDVIATLAEYHWAGGVG